MNSSGLCEDPSLGENGAMDTNDTIFPRTPRAGDDALVWERREAQPAAWTATHAIRPGKPNIMPKTLQLGLQRDAEPIGGPESSVKRASGFLNPSVAVLPLTGTPVLGRSCVSLRGATIIALSLSLTTLVRPTALFKRLIVETCKLSPLRVTLRAWNYYLLHQCVEWIDAVA
jgi:hypothetical protein